MTFVIAIKMISNGVILLTQAQNHFKLLSTK